LGVRLAGCSVDTLEAQRAFAEKVGGLRFPLIADPEAEVAKAYGVFREDWKLAGRATAVIGEDGTILKTYPKAPLDGKGHAEEVYGDLDKLLP
jgi:thioredoxin-dependent peroxiredoxin